MSSGGGEQVHPLDRLSDIYRHRPLVVSVFTIVVTLMMLQSYSTIPLYRATARVQIDNEQSVLVAGLDSNDPVYWTDPEPYFETQYRIIRSTGIARHTVRRLDVTMAPELTSEAPRALEPLGAIRAARATVFEWARAVGASVRGYIRPAALESPATPFRAEEDELLAASDEAGARAAGFASRITVSPVVNTRLVDVEFTSTDPAFAAEAVNTHVETYVQRNLARRLDSVQQTLEWVNSQLATQQAAVEAGDLALADYRVSQDALSLNVSTDIVTTRLASLNDSVTRAETDRQRKESLHNRVTDLDPNGGSALAFPAIAQSAGVSQSTDTVTQLEAERAQLATRYLEQHPEMVRINSEIANANRQVTTAIRHAIRAVETDYQSALSEEQRLQGEFDQQKLRAEDLSRKAVRYSSLERQSESHQRVYENLLQQQNELQIVANSRSNNVQVMNLAQVPGAPFTPNTRRDWMIAALVGLIFAVGLVVVVEHLDDTIKTPDDVSRRLHLPLLGLVPAVRGDRPPLLSAEVPHDFGEAFRSLRTALVFTSGSSSSRVIGVTSTQPLEGKTTSAVNLALALAVGGARVLLIDADMRRPSVHKSLGMANSVGLSNVLVWRARIREAIQRTHHPNLFALTGGQPPPNPSELLASDRMRGLLTSLESGPFDWIVIDSPPVLAVTDSVILAPLMSGMVFAVGAEMTRAAHAERAVEMLRAAGNANVVGVVLNRVDFARDRYYYSRSYGYHHTNYYGDMSAAA